MKWIPSFLIAFLLGALSWSLAAQSRTPPPNLAPLLQAAAAAADDDYDDEDDDDYDDEERYGDGRWSPRREVGFFYDELLPYGDWVYTRQYGWAWFPSRVHPYWRPYTDGYWILADCGWTWVTYEPFGWATYHYGRWAWDPRFGWLWIPGTVWGPAWVSWQSGGGYIGWAPLPPVVGFEAGFGIRLGNFDLSVGIQPDVYTFVPERAFLETRLSGYIEPAARNRTIFRSTRNVTNYTYVDNRVVNRSIDVTRIERARGRPVRQVRFAPDARAKTRSEVASNELRIYRPERRQLDSVAVAPRVNAGQRPESPPPPPRVNRRDDRKEAPEFQVAPRPNAPRRQDQRQIERQQQRAQQDLERHQLEEQRRIQRAQQQELSRIKAQNDRAELQKQHQEQREAMQQAQQNAARQLRERQKAQQEAVRQAPPPRRGGPQGEQPRDKRKPDKPRKRGGGGGGSGGGL